MFNQRNKKDGKNIDVSGTRKTSPRIPVHATMGFPEERTRKVTQNVMAENFPNLRQEMDIQTPESPKTSGHQNDPPRSTL